MNAPIYDQAFYNAILAERRRLGASGGFVDIDECQRVVDSAKHDECHPDYMTFVTKTNNQTVLY